jgi:3-dehydrosphinganine reductase
MKNNNRDWRGKTVLVTGGSSGIGLEIARILVKRGGKVWLLARRQALLERASAEIKETDCLECGILPVDVADPEKVFDAVDFVIKQDGPPFALFNCAGIVHPGYVQELDLQVFQDMMGVNYLGTVYATKAVLPSMLERRSGIIVNIASIAAFFGTYGYTAYSASKFAVRGFSEAMRWELKPFGIQVSIAFPPDTDTPQLIVDNQLKPPELKEMLKIIGSTKPESAKAVAEKIISGVERGRFIILPGKDASLLFWLTTVTGPGTFRVADFVLNRARRNLGQI